MVVTSDNTATDLAIAKVGGVGRVNDWLRTNGYAKALQLTMTTGELFAKYAQLSGQRRLPHFVSVPVAHKTGDFPPVLANDVGVIFTRSGPVVVSFFANGITGSYAEAEDAEGRLAERLVAYFDGKR